ncbi:response regulator [candidate division KSB1 bacterium]
MSKRVLVIDDDPEIIEVIRDLLEFDKVEVISAGTGKDGVFQARYKSPSLIILDFNLPDMNGFEVFKKIKQEEPIKDIPVILITGQTDMNTISMINELKPTAVFYKPFQFAHLRRKVKFLLDAESADSIECRKCGKPLEEIWYYCPFCGLKITKKG